MRHNKKVYPGMQQQSISCRYNISDERNQNTEYRLRDNQLALEYVNQSINTIRGDLQRNLL